MVRFKFLIYLLIFIPIFNKIFNRYDRYYQDLDNINAKIFTNGHILGTDFLGRDLLSRLSYSIILTTTIVFISVFFIALISLIVGTFMAYSNKYISSIIFIIIQILLSIPNLVILLFILVFFGNSILLLIIALTFTRSLRLIIFIRNEVYKIKTLNYIKISLSMGANFFHIFYYHILPNIYSIIKERIILMIPGIIYSESFLSFFGIGLSPEYPSLGNILSSGYYNILINPTQFILASFIIILISITLGGIKSENS